MDIPFSIGQPDHRRSNLSNFYSIGLEGVDEQRGNGWTMLTLQSVVQMLQHDV